MKKLVTAGLGLTLALAGSLAAQQAGIVDGRVAAAQPDRFQIPLCQLRMDGRVNNAQRALRSGIEEQNPERKERAMADVARLLAEAIAADPGNGAAWYYLGRYHLLRGDVVGLDSAWSRAEALVPACETDITAYRQNTWAILTNAGIEMQNNNQLDSAKVLYLRAQHAFMGLPHAFMNLGVIYANQGANDSAAVMFERAVVATEGDTTLVEERGSLMLNLSAVYQRLNNHRESLNWAGRYLAEYPDPSSDVARQAAASYRALGMADSAAAMDAKILAALSSSNLGELSGSDLIAVGVGFFNAEQYDRAEEAFRRAATANPYDRDAVYNLANTYLALRDGAKLASTAAQLRQIEPLSEDAIRLEAQAMRLLGNREADLVKLAEQLVGLPIKVEVLRIAYSGGEGRITALATGRAAVTPEDRPIPPAAMTLTFEFVNAQGEVLGSSDVQVPALPEGQTHQFEVVASTRPGVTGWRYKRK